MELPFLGNYSLRTLIFQMVMYQRSVWTRGEMIKYRVQSKNDYGPTKTNADGQNLISEEVQEGESGRIQTQNRKGSPESPVLSVYVLTDPLSLSHGKVISI